MSEHHQHIDDDQSVADDKLPWDEAYAHAAEVLRGWPAGASADWMKKEYTRVRKALRDAGAVRDDDDHGYRWFDLPDKS